MDTYNNEKITIIQKFVNSLYNFRAYPYFLKETLGKAILYIFLLVLLTSSLQLIKTVVSLNSMFSEMNTVINSEVGDFTISSNGFVTTDEMPIIYEDPAEGIVVIIDNTGSTTEASISKYTKGIFILKDGVILKENNNTTNSFSYSDIGAFTFSKSDLIGFIGTFRIVIYAIVIILLPLFSFIGKLLSLTVILGIFGLIFNAILDLPLGYKDILKLGAYSLTLPVLIDTALMLIGISIPFFNVVYYGIALCFLFLGMKEVKNNLRLEM